MQDANPPNQMTFIGGFDEHVFDVNHSTSFIAMTYPLNNIDSKIKKLGLADYLPKPSTTAEM